MFTPRTAATEVRVHLQQLPGLSLLQDSDLVVALRELINREIGAASELELEFDTTGLSTDASGHRHGTVTVAADFDEDFNALFFVQKLDGIAMDNVAGFACAVAAESVDTKQQFHNLKAVWESLFFEKNAAMLAMGVPKDKSRVIEDVMQQLQEQKGSSYSTPLTFRPDTIVLKNIPMPWVRPPDADACLWDDEGFVPRWRGLHVLAHGEGAPAPHAHTAINLNPRLASMLQMAEVDAPGCLVRWEACVSCNCQASAGSVAPTPSKKNSKKVKALVTGSISTGVRCSCSATVYIMYSSYAPFLKAMIMFHTHSIHDTHTSRVARPSAHCDADGTLRGKGLSKRREAAAERLFRWQANNENKTLQELQDKKAREQVFLSPYFYSSCSSLFISLCLILSFSGFSRLQTLAGGASQGWRA